MGRLSTTEVIEKFRRIHGDRFDYSKVIYSNYHEKVTIICKIHGEYQTSPATHIYSVSTP